MATLSTAVPQVGIIEFHPMPKNLQAKAQKCVVVDRVTWIHTGKKLYTTLISWDGIFTDMSADRITNLGDALLKLNMITKAVRDQLVAEALARAEKRERKFLITDFRTAAQKLGITLPAAVERKLQ